MYFLDGSDEWSNIHTNDLWIYNKLFLGRVLGYNCGPVGASVPKPDLYIVRPSFNLLGMGRFARQEWIENYTDHFHPSEFWCEIFKGEHLSVDFHHQKAELVVLGEKDASDPLYKWKKWTKIDKKVEFPSILNDLVGNYEWINCEFIDGNLIEVHFRRNPDFRYNNSVAIPVWNDELEENHDDCRFVDDSDFNRRGFYIK
jgi:hypothetical protein